jgi:hypothetical protein
MSSTTINPLTRSEQIKAIMAEHNLSYTVARCRIDPEFHEKTKEYKRVYEARRYTECADYRQKVKERAKEHCKKHSDDVREQRREYARRPDVKARRAEQRKNKSAAQTAI